MAFEYSKVRKELESDPRLRVLCEEYEEGGRKLVRLGPAGYLIYLYQELMALR